MIRATSIRLLKRAFTLPALSLCLLLIAPGLLLSAQKQTAKPAKPLRNFAQPRYIPGQVLVEPAGRFSSTEEKQLKQVAGLDKALKTIGPRGQARVRLYSLRSGQTVERAVKKLRASPHVAAAAPNYLRRGALFPTEPRFGEQWGLHNTGQVIEGQTGIADADIDAPEALEITTGASLPVAVIDSGLDGAHPEFTDNRWQNMGEIAGNGIDDDVNGYVDDARGYNFAGISQISGNAGWAFGQSNTYPIAQSIIGTGEPLTHIGLVLAKVGSPAAAVNVYVRSSLSGSNLASLTIAPGEVASFYAEIYRTLNTPVSLNAGQTYYIVFQATSANASNYYGVMDNYSGGAYYVNDPYRDGREYWYNGSSWISYASDDFYFRTNPNANPRDDNGHGTHVAGIIAADSDNNYGVAGVSAGAKIMTLKAGDSSGYLTSDRIINALYYAADSGAKVVNMSFGGSVNSPLEQAAVNYAAGRGVVLFASSGNGGNASLQYPAGYANVVGVGAVDNRDAKASFSTFNSSVDLAAPGVDVLSTMPTYPVALNSYGYVSNFDFLSGTSMAAPMASGAAALVRAYRPLMGPLATEQALENAADDLGSPGRDNSFGYGRVNAARALALLAPPETSLTVAPTPPDGENGWYQNAPLITLTPTGAASATVFYNWDTTASFYSYAGPLSGPSSGSHRLFYYAADSWGGTETVRNRLFQVDGQPPENLFAVGLSHQPGVPVNDNTVDLGIAPATDAVSGLAGYALSWTPDATGLPVPAVNLGAAEVTATSPLLGDGAWYANLRAKDTAGNWSGAVHAGPFLIDTGPPTVTSVDPAGGTVNVPVDVTVTVNFSEIMDTTTFSGANLWLTDATGAVVSVTAGPGGSADKAKIKPASPLAYETTYTVHVGSGAVDRAGNALAAPVSSSFRTEPSLEVDSLSYSPPMFDPQAATATISFTLSKEAWVFLLIVDPFGGSIPRMIGPELRPAGLNEIQFDGRDNDGDLLPPSWYLYNVIALEEGEVASAFSVMNVSWGAPLAYTDLGAAPDPFIPALGDQTVLSFDQNRLAFVFALVFDSSGALVRDLSPGFLQPGTRSVIWDGKDNTGAVVSPGAYHYIIFGIDSGYNTNSFAGTVDVL